MLRKLLLLILLLISITSCHDQTWNNPHPSQKNDNVFYASFAEPPKTLDPAQSFSSDEMTFIAQIYEPPLQYDYTKKVYTLIPLTASKMPTVTFYDKNWKPLPNGAPTNQVAYSVYDIEIKPGIYYQPHPAFAKKHTTRELTARDYVYEIKRLADPRVNSPILSLMEKHILGLKELNKTLENYLKKRSIKFLDLRKFPLKGARVLGKYHYQIILKGKYPQFIYWLAMTFFSPIPWEVDQFYAQKDLNNHNINFDWQPIGTGPYMLTENNPNQRMVLARNPHFRGEPYPVKNDHFGKPMPFIDQYIFSLEKEAIPRWNKFLQGYYDQSAIGSENFDQAIKIDKNGNPQVTENFKQKGIALQTTVAPTVFYLGFNMLDPIIGGNTERARKLRLAIAVAFDTQEWINLFLNGRGIIAQGPIPPGIFGYLDGKKGINPYVFNWENGKAKRKSIAVAKQLLTEAGYPNGIDKTTNQPLVLNFDVAASGGPDEKSQFDWLRKQFAKLGVALNIRSTHYNRYQKKLQAGNAQIFLLGWHADYPDPENFLALFYGPNGKVAHGGENATNYNNFKFNQLFKKMRVMDNSPARQAIISQMVDILRFDTPWVFMFHPKTFVLNHQWVGPSKLHGIANNTFKYRWIDPKQREQLQHQWNQPIVWPLWVLLGLMIVAFLPTILRRK